MKVEERVRPAAVFKPEVASLNMGSINFGLYHLLDKYKEFKFDWERQHLENTRDLVFRNSFKDIEYLLQTCYGNGTRFEFECYDIAHLYNLKHFLDHGLVKPVVRPIGLWSARRHWCTSRGRHAYAPYRGPSVWLELSVVRAGRGA